MLLYPELQICAVRSSGPGGQHVNKVNTKIELRFDITGSAVLTPKEKEMLMNRIKTRISEAGILIITSQQSRSQLTNKEAAIKQFDELLKKALKPRKKRKSTKPTKQSVEKRKTAKRSRSAVKQQRRKPWLTD